MCFRQSSTVMRAMCGSLEAVDQITVAGNLSGGPQTGRAHDTHQVFDGIIEIVVNNNIVKFGQMRDLASRSLHSAFYDAIRVLSAIYQSRAQRVGRRGKDEDADGFRHQLAHLPS